MFKPKKIDLSNPQTEKLATTDNLQTRLADQTERETGHVKQPWVKRFKKWLGVRPKEVWTEHHLKLAIEENDLDEVMFLLEEGVTPDKHPEWPWLVWACQKENRALLDLLTIHGADLNTKHGLEMGRGQTALHEAVRRRWVKGIKLLLEAGALREELDKKGHTPLFIAVRKGYTDVVRLLLESGAKPTGDSGLAALCLHEASHPDVVDMLMMAGARWNIQDKSGMNALHKQVKSGRLEVVRALLFHQANPNLLDAKGRTAWFWVGRGQASEIQKVLWQSNVEIETIDMDGNSAAHFIAFRAEREEVILEAYQKRNDLWNQANRKGETPIMILMRCGRLALASKLQVELGKKWESGWSDHLQSSDHFKP